MMRNEIIDMAREAGGRFSDAIVRDAWLPFLERFAALVAAREREECAKACGTQMVRLDRLPNQNEFTRNVTVGRCVEAIRARGTT